MAERPGMTEATWVNGKRRVKGWWRYNWGSDSFTIVLVRKNKLTGEKEQIIVTHNDTPEWGNWRRANG